MHRRFIFGGLFILTGMLFLSGCVATRKFVRNEIVPVNQKITEVDNKTRENAERIDGVDRKATQGIADARTAAATAQTAAQAADGKAVAAQTTATAAQAAAATADGKAVQANTAVTAANTRITAVDAKFNTLDRYDAGPLQTIMFKVGSAVLDDTAMKALDTIAGQVSGMPRGYVVEIQGFASSDGAELLNLNLSQKRADAVQRYLVSKNVPLFRISMLGLGEEKPVADNKTRDGRIQNRRVEVRVLRAQGMTAGND